jgi:hypothetical protein
MGGFRNLVLRKEKKPTHVSIESLPRRHVEEPLIKAERFSEKVALVRVHLIFTVPVAGGDVVCDVESGGRDLHD